MKQTMLACAAILLWGLGGRGQTWGFTEKAGELVARGMLKVAGEPHGNGVLFFDGKRFRLTGYGEQFQGWYAFAPKGWRFCLVFAPVDPWVMGVIAWHGTEGVLDMLSTDLVRNEVLLNVRATIE